MNYIYVILLLLGTVVPIIGIGISLNAPKKLKLISISSFTAILFRYIILWIFFLSTNITYLYLFKVLFFNNIFVIPIIALEEIYILWRNNKIRFDYIIFISIGMVAMYLYLIYNSVVTVHISRNFLLGYTSTIIYNKIIYYIQIVINSIVLSIIIFLLSNNSKEKIGMSLVAIASFITVIETIMYLLNYLVFPQYLLGEIIWSLSLIYLFSKMKTYKKHH